jgi:hypothetical protein
MELARRSNRLAEVADPAAVIGLPDEDYGKPARR